MQVEQFDQKKLQCLFHPQHSLSLVSLSLKCPYNKRFICIGCLLESKDLENVVAFQDFVQDPITFLDINKEYQLFYQFDSYCKTIKLIEELKNIMTQQLQDTLKELEVLKMRITELKNNHQPQKEDLLKRLKFDKFCSQYDMVWNMDSYQGTKEYEQLEQQLQELVLNFKDCCHYKFLEIINDQGKFIEDFTQKFQQQVEKQFSQEQNLYIQIRTELVKLNITQNGIRFFVHKEISKDKLVKYDLIYEGSRDGLTLSRYWQKCDLQSQLLTIFTLKNGITFGGYSPCQIDKSISNYIVDSTNSSFLFSYNREEIYRQKNKERTIYCRHDCGPSFGTGMDFYSAKDFTQIGSLLGVTFDITGYNVTNKHTHLIGSKDADVADCKVYKVTFM
ncbi:hypothetical protein pb186bvf_007452 [Paramecium bursaria]